MEQYLFHQIRSIDSGKEASWSIHTHDFWQVDFIEDGSGTFCFYHDHTTLQYKFSSNDTIIIPPGYMHNFFYDDAPARWLSVKFISYANTAAPVVLNSENMLIHAKSIINEALSPHFMSMNSSMNIVNAALSVVIGRYILSIPGDTSEFVRKIKEFIYSQPGRDIRVSEVGEYLNCTGKHAALRFKQETGLSLKSFLDQHRADFAGRLLRTSNTSLNELAKQLNFRDVYSFSRFFKRITHLNLSEFRKQQPDPR